MALLRRFLAAAAGLVAVVKAASLEQVTDFGDNSSGTKMYIYVPDAIASGNTTNVPIVVAIHYCAGTASAYYSGTPYATLADSHGFIVIYPESPYSGTCWDVSSAASETHDGGADTSSIANMVSYTIAKYNADKSRVFVTGSSSGAMMTNLLAATYPDVFAAATVYSGVPAGCFYTGTVDGWNTTCSAGESIHTQEVWRDVALAMYPGYTGTRTRMLIFHGSADTALYPPVSEKLEVWLSPRSRHLTDRHFIMYLGSKLTTDCAKNTNAELQRNHQAMDWGLQLLSYARTDPSGNPLVCVHQVHIW